MSKRDNTGHCIDLRESCYVKVNQQYVGIDLLSFQSEGKDVRI